MSDTETEGENGMEPTAEGEDTDTMEPEEPTTEDAEEAESVVPPDVEEPNGD